MSTQQIFFSYSRSDSPFALTLAKDLREAGADIWIDQLDIPAGTHWDAAVEKALNSAAYVLVILSPASTASTNVMDEVSFALESGKKIIPVLLEDCLAPFRLRRLQRIDFTSDYTSGFSQLVISLNLAMGTTPKTDGIAVEPVKFESLAPEKPNEDVEARQKRDSRLWEDACKQNTIASYKRYLADSHDGSFIDEARLLIKQLEVEQKEDELESLLWQKVKTERTKNLYQHYLQEYPNGNYKTLALTALADIEKIEKAEAQRLRDIEAAKEKERAQQAKLQREKEEALEREKALKAKEEREKELALEREKAAKAKEQREKELALEREKAAKEKQEKERLLQIEKEKAAREKAEKEKLLQEQKAKAAFEKQESDRLKQLEKEKIAREKQLEKERIAKEKLERGEVPATGNGKKYALIGGGILLLCLVGWGIMKMSSGGDKEAWKAALAVNDSTAFAQYQVNYPEGKYYTKAKERIDSLYWLHKAAKDSLAAIAAAQEPIETDTVTTTPPTTPTTTPLVTKNDPAKKVVPPVKPKPNTTSTTKSTAKPAPKFAIGQLYQGGYIFYLNGAGDHGLIVYFKDLPNLNWETAQKRCANFKSEGYEDWRLPTKGELTRIYQARTYIGIYSKSLYWSSTEANKDTGWAQNFKDGLTSQAPKQTAIGVRPVRSF
jgi:hypothetical protein